MSLMTTQRHVIHPRDDVNIQQHVNIQQRDDTADKLAVSYSRQGWCTTSSKKKHRLVVEVESVVSSSKKNTTRRREDGGVVVEKI